MRPRTELEQHLDALLVPQLGHRPARWPAAVLAAVSTLGKARGVTPLEFVVNLRVVPEPDVIAALVTASTVNHTAFRRHPAQFERLRRECASTTGIIKIWCAGCSTGEEAISIVEAVRSVGARPSVLATDLDAEAVAFARRGVYADSRGARLVPEGGGFRAPPDVASCIDYRVESIHNVPAVEEPDFDFVFCRNVLIYFTQQQARSILAVLAGHARRAVVVAPTDFVTELPPLLQTSETTGWLERRQTPTARSFVTGDTPVAAMPDIEPGESGRASQTGPSLAPRHGPSFEDEVADAVGLNPHDPVLWFRLGELLLQRGEIVQARVAYRRTIEHVAAATDVDPETLRNAVRRRLASI